MDISHHLLSLDEFGRTASQVPGTFSPRNLVDDPPQMKQSLGGASTDTNGAGIPAIELHGITPSARANLQIAFCTAGFAESNTLGGRNLREGPRKTSPVLLLHLGLGLDRRL